MLTETHLSWVVGKLRSNEAFHVILEAFFLFCMFNEFVLPVFFNIYCVWLLCCRVFLPTEADPEAVVCSQLFSVRA